MNRQANVGASLVPNGDTNELEIVDAIEQEDVAGEDEYCQNHEECRGEGGVDSGVESLLEVLQAFLERDVGVGIKRG